MSAFVKNKCCRAECNKRFISPQAIDRQAALLEALHAGRSSEGRRNLRAHMQHTFLLTWARDQRDTPRKEHGSTYRTSTVKSKLCRDAWLALHDVNMRTWQRWLRTMDRLDPTPPLHRGVGCEGDASNAYKADARQIARLFVLGVADAEGHAVPVRTRDADGNAHFSFEAAEDQPTYLPPKYTKRGLYRAYLRDNAGDSTISWSSFRTVLKDIKSVVVSKRQRGLCDTCFAFRDSMRTLKQQERLDETARDYAAHLTDADAMLQQYRASKAAAKLEWAKHEPAFVVLAFDYARQLGVPHLGDETTEGFWATKKALDVNLFGIVNEGGGTYGLGTPYLVPERVKSGSDTVCSMLHHYITNDSKVQAARELHLWSDSCTGQNKNNIVLAFLMLLVHTGVYDVVDWRFFTVGHSKFDPDRMFGTIRSTLHKQTVLTTPELKNLLDDISGIHNAVLFRAEEVRDWHGATKAFHAVPNIRKTFYYRLSVRRVDNSVVVYTYDSPHAEPKAHRLLKKDKVPPALDDYNAMPRMPAPELSLARRQDLEKTVLGYIMKSGRAAPDVVEFWRVVIGNTSTPASSSSLSISLVAPLVQNEVGGNATDSGDECDIPDGTTRHDALEDTTPSPRTGDGVVSAVRTEQPAADNTDQVRRQLATTRREKRRSLLAKSRARQSKRTRVGL